MSRLKDIFRGKVVNKRLTVNTGVDEFPRYVVEYLIDNYCSEENFEQDLQMVVKRLRENFVHGAETEKIRHQIRESRNHAIIANLEVRLEETEDKYWGSISAINENFVNVSESLVRQYPMLLSGGMWGTITLSYDETEIHNKKIRPFKVAEFTPFQISVIDVNEFIEKRRKFGDDEWLDVMINSIGLNPELMNRREKLLYMLRLVPLIESNFNCIELAPRETGKTYLYRNISYFTHVLSGGKATPASLFINNANGKVGIVGSRDAVVFDEIANTDFTDPKALVSIMQGYMQDAKFSRGKKEILAHASIVLVGNLDVQNKLPHEKYYHLFEPLPSFLQVEAFIDRIHCYTPGWEIPKIRPDSMSQSYGFITDYASEIMHDMRRVDLLGKVKSRYRLKDASTSGGGITGRDVRGIEKTLSGLLKLLYPHGDINDEALGELLELALECRQRVRNQLHLMAPGEYGPIKLAATIISTGKDVVPTLPDAFREQKVSLPSTPRVGEVTGLAVIGDDRGCLLHFEVQASKGGGRIISLGSMQRVMKESVAAAAQFVKVHARILNLPTDWQDNLDVAVLATMMGVPKEGPSAGITITTGIVSALLGKAVRNDIAMTGEITIMGKVLGVGGILPKLQAAVEAGCKEVIVPSENARDVELVPSYIREKLTVNFASTIEDVLNIALIEVKFSLPEASSLACDAEPDGGSDRKSALSDKTVGELIAGGEGTRCEFKSTLRVNLHTKDKDKKIELSALKTIAGFLNTHGGHLIIGVNDQGELLGLENDDFPNEDKMNLHLVNLLKQRLGPQHLVHVDLSFDTVDDKRVLVVACCPSSLPVYYRDGATEQFFIRTGAATTELLPSEIQGYLKQRFER